MASIVSVNAFIVFISKCFIKDPSLLYSISNSLSNSSKFHSNKSFLQNTDWNNSFSFLIMLRSPCVFNPTTSCSRHGVTGTNFSLRYIQLNELEKTIIFNNESRLQVMNNPNTIRIHFSIRSRNELKLNWRNSFKIALWEYILRTCISCRSSSKFQVHVEPFLTYVISRSEYKHLEMGAFDLLYRNHVLN